MHPQHGDRIVTIDRCDGTLPMYYMKKTKENLRQSGRLAGRRIVQFNCQNQMSHHSIGVHAYCTR